MKKGLLALMVVAMVAMAVPAGALAPTIDPLPGVILGSAGETADVGGETYHLFRYNNILDITASSKIHWNNEDLGFGDAQKHAYYMMESAASPIIASTASRFVTQVTAADIAAIQTAGTRPAPAKEITDAAGDGGVSDFFFLSLVNNPSAATNSYTATAADNGRPATAFAFDPEVLTLVVADGDFPTTAMAQAEMTVYTVAGEEDGFSPAAIEMYAANFANAQNNWWWNTFAPQVNGATVVLGQHPVNDGGLTIQGSASAGPANIYYGAWVSSTDGAAAASVVDVDVASQTGLIFRATYTLSGSAATDAATPGYRLMASSEGLTHLAGMAVFAGEGYFGPSQAGNLHAMIFWQTPTTLNGFGDADIQATVQAPKDYRDYIMEFDMVDFVAADTGSIGLLNLLVEMVAEPDVASNLITWGSGATGFDGDLAVSGWNVGSSADTNPLSYLGYTIGTATRTANSIVMGAGTSAAGYKAIGMFGSASALPAWTSNQLVRVQSTWATSVTNATPTWRMLTLPVNSSGLSGAITWFDAYDGSTIKTLYSPGTLATSPVAGGSTINSFIWTATALAGGKLSPNIDCYSVGAIGSWPNSTSNMTLSRFSYDVMAY